MRFVFIGSGSLSIATARMLVERNHEVIIIEKDRERIETLSESIDCGFLHGDGSKPAILRESDPARTDTLFCMSSNDQTNIIASLVGRSLGFKKVITKVEEEEFEHICLELGLEKSIVPARTIGRYLADYSEGQTTAEIGTMIKGDARLFSFIALPGDQIQVRDLKLPGLSRVIAVYRDEQFTWPDDDLKLSANDEVVIITHSKHIQSLRERWGASAGKENSPHLIYDNDEE